MIQATLWCFENIGIEKTTRTAVEKQAGVTGRSIQRYFGSIENLIVETMNTYLQNYTYLLYSEFQKNNDPKSSGLEQLKTFFRTHLMFYEKSINSSLLVHEIELYFVKNGLFFQCINPKVYDRIGKKVLYVNCF
ncbi:MAG: TetR/AcrR family transcriptional regulator [Clostridiales bacterium]|nr:TetR/AcrR family transcriptional regulator [Clostridiales bacterium]